MKQIHALTGLRGLAVLIVFLSHSANESMLPAVLGRGFGQIGVMLFFLLSGFLMAHLYISETFDRIHVRAYALARVARVVPLYITIIFGSFVVSNYINEDFYYRFTEFLPIFLALIFAKAPYVFWTIPVEIQFYFVFVGFWYLYSRKYSLLALFAFVIFTTVPAIVIFLIFEKFPKSFSLYSLYFFLGVGTSFVYKKFGQVGNGVRYTKHVGVVFMVLLFVNLPLLRLEYDLVYSEVIFLRTWGDPLTCFIVYGVFLCTLFNPRSMQFLSWKCFALLGELSFGFYLIHYPVLVFVSKMEMHLVGKLLLSFSITLAISFLSLLYFEKPISKSIRRRYQS